MIKTSLIALAVAASVSVAAAPAFADTDLFGTGDASSQQFAKDSVVSELRRDGINATSVEEWNGYIRAFVILDDGSQVMQFFEPGSLNPVSPGASGAAGGI